MFGFDIFKKGSKTFFLNCKHDGLNVCLWHWVCIWTKITYNHIKQKKRKTANSSATWILAISANNRLSSPVGVLQKCLSLGNVKDCWTVQCQNEDCWRLMETHKKDNDQISRFLTHIPVEPVTANFTVPALSYNSFHFTTFDQVPEAA